MCNVPSTAVFCIDPLYASPVLFTDMFSHLVTIPVDPVIIVMMKHFIFHTCLVSKLRFFILISFQSPFVLHSYPMVPLRLSMMMMMMMMMMTTTTTSPRPF
jgi:hypothetical protein